MAKKKNNNNGGAENNNTTNNDGGEKKNAADGGGEKKKDDSPISVVLKVDMHCEGCATKIVKCVKSFQGVESVKSESQANKLTVVGKVDPTKLRDKLAEKTKKKVDLISPQPNKDNKDKDDANDTKKKPEKSNDDNKKPKEKELPVTTAVLKLNLHCQGCVQKIHKTVSKTKGFLEMSIDKQKDLVTVKGSMDMKELAENLKEKLKRPVDIVPPKKEKAENAGGGGGGGGDKKKKEEGGGEGNAGGGGNGKLEGHKMEYPMGQPGFGHVPYGFVYGPGYGGYPYPYPPQTPPSMFTGNPLHAPQIFSDENPNACTIM